MPVDEITHMGQARKQKVAALVQEAKKKHWTPGMLAERLKRVADTPTKRDKRDWYTVARTELTDVKAHDSIDAILEKHGRKARVIRKTGDACEACLHAFGHPSKPRVWTAGTIPDHLKGAVHPNCKCSPWLVVGIEKIKKSTFLIKGSLQKKMKLTAPPSEEAFHWMRSGFMPAKRQAIPRAEGDERKRMLHKLHGLTDVKKHADGTRSFLMHRGMGGGEFQDNIKDGKYSSKERTSWTPSLKTAKHFARREALEKTTNPVVSAWVHENDIHSMPAMKVGKNNSKATAAVRKEQEFLVGHEKQSNHSPVHNVEHVSGYGGGWNEVFKKAFIVKSGYRAFYGEIRHRKSGTWEKTVDGWKKVKEDKDGSKGSWAFDPKDPKQYYWKQYYNIDKNSPLPIKNVIDNWMKYKATPADAVTHAKYKAKDLLPYREYYWNESKNRHGKEEWESLKQSIKAGGWSEDDPLILMIDRKDRRVYVGEGNHRLNIIKEVFGDDYEVPVRFYCTGGADNVFNELKEEKKRLKEWQKEKAEKLSKAFKLPEFNYQMRFVIAKHLKPKKISKEQWKEKVKQATGEGV
jgi:hypothetical protein